MSQCLGHVTCVLIATVAGQCDLCITMSQCLGDVTCVLIAIVAGQCDLCITMSQCLGDVTCVLIATVAGQCDLCITMSQWLGHVCDLCPNCQSGWAMWPVYYYVTMVGSWDLWLHHRGKRFLPEPPQKIKHVMFSKSYRHTTLQYFSPLT